MPRTEEQNAKMRQATRDKIQMAAAELFAQKGLAGTNVQEIADLAGISIGLFYRHYKTKEALFTEMVNFALDDLVEITKLFRSENASPKELISQVTNEIYKDLKENGEFVNTLIFMTQAFLSDPSQGETDRLIAQDAEMIKAMAELIKRGQELGEMRSGDPMKMTTLFFSAIQGLGVMKAVMKDDIPVPDPAMLTAHIFAEGEN